VYQFTRLRRYRHILAIAGARKPGRPVLAAKPSKVDITWQGVTEQGGAELWMVGTDTAKDWIVNRFKLTGGPGAPHYSQDLPLEYYKQLTAERKVVRYVKGFKRIDWVKPNGARNEAFDLSVYNLAAAHYAGMHRWSKDDWDRLRLYFAQGDLLAPPAPPMPTAEPEEEAELSALATPTPTNPAAKPMGEAPIGANQISRENRDWQSKRSDEQ
jgi:phage terminase large subunit GpA-like protein